MNFHVVVVDVVISPANAPRFVLAGARTVNIVQPLSAKPNVPSCETVPAGGAQWSLLSSKRWRVHVVSTTLS